MKKKIVGLMLGVGLMTTAPIMLTACGDTPPAEVLRLYVTTQNADITIDGNNVTMVYGSVTANHVCNMFNVMAEMSNNTEMSLVQSNTGVSQGDIITYMVDTNIPQSLPNNDYLPVGTYYYNVAASNGMTINLNVTVTKAEYDIGNITWNDYEMVYNGQEYVFEINTHLPEGVSVSYTGNRATDAGTYTAIAHFTSNDPNYEQIPDVTQNWTIHKAKIELEPMISGRVYEISQREYYDAMTYGSGINWFYDRQGGPSISLEDMITGDIEYTTTYEVFGAPGTYSVSMGGFTLKEEYAKNYELDIKTSKLEITESLVTIVDMLIPLLVS